MTRDAGEQPIAVDAETRDNLHMLHALRLALIQRLMMLRRPCAGLLRPPRRRPMTA